MTIRNTLHLLAVLPLFVLAQTEADTLPPRSTANIPQTVEDAWAGFDPRAEPLDVEVIKAWEVDGVSLKVLRYRIGTFKGRPSMMAAIYGHPTGQTNLPGLVQIHGGGQYADEKAVLTNAKRGYATISIAWAGRLNAKGYTVNPAIVQLFWDGATTNPQYKVTTDWGAVEAYHAPSRHKKNQFPSLPGAEAWTLDPAPSPRNNSWFLCALGARRALTFLEQQAEVDPDNLGVYGHSMGGKLTVLTSGSDTRVKACAPSCGGISDRYNKDPLFAATIGDDVYLKRIKCPTMFLSPANDFHGRINDLQTALTEIATPLWRMNCAPHHNHQDSAPYEVATQLWFDEHLKGSFRTPTTPITKLALTTPDQVPHLEVIADTSRTILAVDVFYTQQGQEDAQKDDRDNTVHRFWHHASTQKSAESWSSRMPLLDTDRPLWVYANVTYALDAPITGAGYYYGIYTTDRFVLSSRMIMIPAHGLQAARSKATLTPTHLIEPFEGDWDKEWFTYRAGTWPRSTNKLYEPTYAAPAGATLALDVRSEQTNTLVIAIDKYAAEAPLTGSADWQTITLSPADFGDADGGTLANWAGSKQLRLNHQETLRSAKKGPSKNVGGAWKGPAPEFRNLRWVPTR